MRDDLFKFGAIKLHSGGSSDFKIECDSLTDGDINTLAYLISKRFDFYGIHGIPTGGVRLAKALKKYKDRSSIYYLIVDDVLTTGDSMEKAAVRFGSNEPLIGVVIFSRSEYLIPRWVYPIFDMHRFIIKGV